MTALFLTPSHTEPGAATPPMPESPGSLYLVGLLAKQQGLNAAKDALLARVAFAGTDETRFIEVQLGRIHADYLKIGAMITAYLQYSTIVQAISQEGLAAIRDIVQQLHALKMQRDQARQVLVLVTKLLNEWDGTDVPATGNA